MAEKLVGTSQHSSYAVCS